MERRSKNTFLPFFSDDEKARLKHEIKIIEETNSLDLIISFIEKADEAKNRGDYYVEGRANCSFLLYAVGATTVNPLFTQAPFELFINPLLKEEPQFEIVFSPKYKFTPEEGEMELDKFIIYRAEKLGLLGAGQFEKDCRTPTAARYQFVQEVVSESEGKIIWYEQAIELLSRMGGFSYAQADLLGRTYDGGFSERDSRFTQPKLKFIERAVQAGYSSEYASEYFRYIFKRLSNCNLPLKSHVAAEVFGKDI